MLLACVMLFSVLVAPEVEAKEETVTQIAEMRAMGQFDFELPPKTLMKANSSFPMERGETVKITASYSPESAESASVDFGLIDSDGIFYPIRANDGSIKKTIKIDLKGTYTFAVRNNSNDTVWVNGFVNY